jgi:hypothetical protein
MNQQPNFDIYIGRPFLEVGKEIKIKFGDKYKIQVLTYDSVATCDYVTSRIRVYLDMNNRIERMSIG